MPNLELLDRLKEAMNQPSEGWDISIVNRWGGKLEFPIPWDYHEIVSSYLKETNALLDLGTGGGEFLSTLKDLPTRTCATESFSPNFSVAQKRLNPLNIEVINVKKGTQENAILPFGEERFDLVVCRHDFYDSKEVFRVLKPGGIFITQQVGSDDLVSLKLLFGNIELNEWSYGIARNHLTASGFNVKESKQHIAPTRFYDIRTVAYYLKKLKWNFPDFSLDRDYSRLQNVDFLIQRDGYFEDKFHRFLILAKKEMSSIHMEMN